MSCDLTHYINIHTCMCNLQPLCVCVQPTLGVLADVCENGIRYDSPRIQYSMTEPRIESGWGHRSSMEAGLRSSTCNRGKPTSLLQFSLIAVPSPTLDLMILVPHGPKHPEEVYDLQHTSAPERSWHWALARPAEALAGLSSTSWTKIRRRIG